MWVLCHILDITVKWPGRGMEMGWCQPRFRDADWGSSLLLYWFRGKRHRNSNQLWNLPLLRIEQYYEAILALWNQLYINMKSLVSWHYCMIDIEKIRAMTIAKVGVHPAFAVMELWLSAFLHSCISLINFCTKCYMHCLFSYVLSYACWRGIWNIIQSHSRSLEQFKPYVGHKVEGRKGTVRHLSPEQSVIMEQAQRTNYWKPEALVLPSTAPLSSGNTCTIV